MCVCVKWIIQYTMILYNCYKYFKTLQYFFIKIKSRFNSKYLKYFSNRNIASIFILIILDYIIYDHLLQNPYYC